MAGAGSKNVMLSKDIEAGSNSGYASETEKVILVDLHSENMDYEHDAEVDKWADSLAKMLEDVPQYMCNPGHPARISRIPGNLREVDIKSYEPYFLSIGPYHHGKESLKQMENMKWTVLKCFLEHKHELTLKDFLNEMKSIEPIARSFYSEVDMDSEKFVQMLLFDSFYIVTVFSGMAKNHEWMNQTSTTAIHKQKNEGMINGENKMTVKREDGPEDETRSGDTNVDRPQWFWPFFLHDLFLLENQLPFIVLQRMYVLAYGGSETQFISIMKDIVRTMLPDYVNVYSEMAISPTEEFHHLLHLCHLFFRPALQQEYCTYPLTEPSQMFRLGSALQLYKEGVRFEARSGSTNYTLIDVTFDSCGKMVIPCLYVDDNTASLLRNLIALEQMKYPSLGLNISAYAVLLLHLITTPDDVKLLRRKGIIKHHLASDKEMMYLINRLSVGLSFDYVEDDYSLKPLFQELKRYSERRTPRWRAWLRQRYFNNPWTLISLIAASLLLLFTVIQTFYSVYSYYRPPRLDGKS